MSRESEKTIKSIENYLNNLKNSFLEYCSTIDEYGESKDSAVLEKLRVDNKYKTFDINILSIETFFKMMTNGTDKIQNRYYLLLNHNQIDKDILEIIKIDSDIKKHFTDEELLTEIHPFAYNIRNFLFKLISGSYVDSNNDVDVISFVNSLKEEQEYTAFIWLEGLNIPEGKKILKFQTEVPPYDHKQFSSDLSFLNKVMLQTNPQQSMNFEEYAWAKITYKTFKKELIVNDLYRELEIHYSILSLFMNVDLDAKEPIGLLFRSTKGLILNEKASKHLNSLQYRRIYSSVNYSDVEPFINIFTNIIEKDNYSKLEDRLLRSIQLFGLSRLSYKAQIRFLLVVSACDCLLPQHISEMASFIIESENVTRHKTFRLMKELYDKRSKFVHGKADVKICSLDVASIEDIYRKLVKQLLIDVQKYNELEAKYTQGKKDEALNYYFDTYVFNLPR